MWAIEGVFGIWATSVQNSVEELGGLTFSLDPYHIYPLLRPIFLLDGNHNGFELLAN